MVEEDAFLSWSWVSLLLLSEAPWLLELWSVEEEEAFEEPLCRLELFIEFKKTSSEVRFVLG
jgi:hypothetical protein